MTRKGTTLVYEEGILEKWVSCLSREITTHHHDAAHLSDDVSYFDWAFKDFDVKFDLAGLELALRLTVIDLPFGQRRYDFFHPKESCSISTHVADKDDPVGLFSSSFDQLCVLMGDGHRFLDEHVFPRLETLDSVYSLSW